MRTKTLLLSAAVLAAGISASMAQSVYSINAVGYVNLTLLPGFNLICNPLNGTNNNLNTIIPAAPQDSVVLKWSNANQNFSDSATFFDAPTDPTVHGWRDGAFALSSIVFAPGEGFFFQKPGSGNITLTFVGEVPQGNLTNNIGPNNGFYSSIVPQSAGLTTIGFPSRQDMLYTSWNAASQSYVNQLTYFDAPTDPTVNGWRDGSFNQVDPTPAVGEGFLLFNPGTAVSWTRSFSVNN